VPDVKESPYLHHVGSVFTGSAPAFKAPGGICAAPEVTGDYKRAQASLAVL
jgi:hypothetical protein